MLNNIDIREVKNGSLGNFENPFRNPQYILLNLAIGGRHGGTLQHEAFPMRYEVDYVRVWQQKQRNHPSTQAIKRLCQFCGTASLFHFQPLQQILVEVFDPCLVHILCRLHGANEKAWSLLKFSEATVVVHFMLIVNDEGHDAIAETFAE